jgi:hypothetical protein
MLFIIEIIVGLIDLLAFWRFWLTIAPSVAAAVVFHRAFPNHAWPWFLSIPFLIAALIAGIHWQWLSRSALKRAEAKQQHPTTNEKPA